MNRNEIRMLKHLQCEVKNRLCQVTKRLLSSGSKKTEEVYEPRVRTNWLSLVNVSIFTSKYPVFIGASVDQQGPLVCTNSAPDRDAFLSPPSQTTAVSVKERKEGLLAPQCRLC